jgi:hypothetical protein
LGCTIEKRALIQRWKSDACFTHELDDNILLPEVLHALLTETAVKTGQILTLCPWLCHVPIPTHHPRIGSMYNPHYGDNLREFALKYCPARFAHFVEAVAKSTLVDKEQYLDIDRPGRTHEGAVITISLFAFAARQNNHAGFCTIIDLIDRRLLTHAPKAPAYVFSGEKRSLQDLLPYEGNLRCYFLHCMPDTQAFYHQLIPMYMPRFPVEATIDNRNLSPHPLKNDQQARYEILTNSASSNRDEADFFSAIRAFSLTLQDTIPTELKNTGGQILKSDIKY